VEGWKEKGGHEENGGGNVVEGKVGERGRRKVRDVRWERGRMEMASR